MTKAELIASVVETTGLTKKDAEKAVSAVFHSITNALTNGDKVQLAGFGTFETRDRAARMGLNPLTQEKIEIPATTVPAFKAAKALKTAVAGK